MNTQTNHDFPLLPAPTERPISRPHMVSGPPSAPLPVLSQGAFMRAWAARRAARVAAQRASMGS